MSTNRQYSTNSMRFFAQNHKDIAAREAQDLLGMTPVEVAEKVAPVVAEQSEKVSSIHTVEAFNKAVTNFQKSNDGNLLTFLAKFDLQGAKSKQARSTRKFFDSVERQEVQAIPQYTSSAPALK